MFGPFWIAKHTVRAFTPRRRSCGKPYVSNNPKADNIAGGAIVGVFLLVAAIAVIGGHNNTYAPPSGTYGYTQNSSGQLVPSYNPGDGGGHYVGGPAWTPGPPLPAYMPPPAPIPPAVDASALTVNWGLATLGAIIAILGGLALIGLRMKPQAIPTRTRYINFRDGVATTLNCSPAFAERLATQLGMNPDAAYPETFYTWLRNNWRPPENPAQWSNRR